MGLEKLHKITHFEENLFLRKEVKDLKVELGKSKAYIDELEDVDKKLRIARLELTKAVSKRNQIINDMTEDLKQSPLYVHMKKKLDESYYINEKLTQEIERITQ